jgi:uncharacterized membrane protein YkvA (DUF1232 family)
MRIVLDLSDSDIRYFRKCLRKVREGKRAQDQSVVLRSAADLMQEVADAEAPEFVRDRMGRLEQLIRMLEDDEWRLTGTDRARVLNALAYFADPDDLIPDRIPGIGYLDDAIMVELVVQELRHEIDAYQKFCEFRSTRKPDTETLEKQRASLQSRMRRARRRDRESRRAQRPSGRSPLGLW